MGRVHFIGGEKGGVGKSMTARLLAQYFIDRRMTFKGFDLDQSHATFSRFYAGFTSALKVDDFTSLDQMLEYAEQNPDHELVVDLAAQTSKYLDRWIEDSAVFEIFNELGYECYFWHVMDDGIDSLQLLATMLERYPEPQLNLVVVMNFGRGEDFNYFLESDTFKALRERKARVFQLKKLETGLAQKIDFNNGSFWMASNNHEVMSLVERKRVGIWLMNCYRQLDKLLLPPEESD
jgi:hypothetical protein